MPSNNRLQPIWAVLARSTRYITYTTEEDIATFYRRASSEGPEFYARGLHALRTSFLAGLESGKLDIRGVRFRCKRGTSLPAFLHDAFNKVFSSEGELLDNADVGAIACINQLTAVFTKLEGGHTPESEVKCIESFVKTEEEIQCTCPSLTEVFKTRSGHVSARFLVEKASTLISRVLAGVNPREISPAHGPGVSACGTPQWARYGVPRFIKEIDEIWSMPDYYFASYTAVCDQLSDWLSTEEDDANAKVILVPKDARGPRLISCESKERMWIQQGLMDLLYKTIERCPLTRGSVNFTDQSPNQKAAHLGSLAYTEYRSWVESESGPIQAVDFIGVPSEIEDMNVVTLDLKDASDRLRLDIVQKLFPTEWAAALTACRSSATLLPDGRIVRLAKHAPMGSAVCFPVMALVIWSLISALIPRERDKHVLVYGDDIVVHRKDAPDVIRLLECCGLTVNTHKSFLNGPFRESCGKEYYNGTDVTPVRLRSYPDDNVASRMKVIAFANNLFIRDGDEPSAIIRLIEEWYGLQPTSQFCTSKPIAKWTKSNTLEVNHVSDHTYSGVILKWIPDNQHLRTRWNSRLCRREYRVQVPEARTVKYGKDDWSQVLRALVQPRTESQFGVDALAKRVRYKFRWQPLG